MLLRRNVDPRTLILIGMFTLAAGNIAGWLLQRRHVLGEDLVDAVRGVLTGIAIATLLLGVWRYSRRG